MLFECGKLHAGPLTQGMSREQVRSLLGGFAEFRKSESSENTTDDFREAGVHVYYDATDFVKAVEIFRGNQVVVQGVDIFGFDLVQSLDLLSKRSVGHEEIDSGFELVGLGIRFYVPELYDSDRPGVEAVYVVLKESRPA